MRKRKSPHDPVDDYLRSEGFYYKEKARRESETHRFSGPVKRVRYDRTEKNRKLLMFDLLVILIMMGVIAPFAKNFLTKPQDYYGYKLHWDYSFGTDRVYHTLTVEAPGDQDISVLPENLLIEVLFTATGGEEVALSDLPPAPGGVRLITGEIPLEKLPDYVGCRVTLGDREKAWKVYTGKVRYLPRLKRPGRE
ncbi:MAG: hypothetical protein JXA95_15730 [Spirochaetales bacterium]|nr:hypothetical protein [Spirochaetales bacterium]